ncbi:MAG: hypothetical protein ACE5KZ_08650 [Candidatus Scalinduaceae bacterium]
MKVKLKDESEGDNKNDQETFRVIVQTGIRTKVIAMPNILYH